MLLQLLALSLGASGVWAEPSNDNSAGVQAIADAYIAATYEGDAETLRKIFHESAVMNGYMDGKLLMSGPEPFIEQMGSNPSLKASGAPYKAAIDYIDVSGNIGSVTISETGFGPKSFTNYLHVLKQDGEWKIVSKTFTGE